MPAGHPRTLDPSCSDADGDTISYTKLSEPTHGTLSDAGGTLVYTPADGYTGPDQFNYKATDGHGGESAPTTHHVQVVIPSAPTCTAEQPGDDADQQLPLGPVSAAATRSTTRSPT